MIRFCTVTLSDSTPGHPFQNNINLRSTLRKVLSGMYSMYLVQMDILITYRDHGFSCREPGLLKLHWWPHETGQWYLFIMENKSLHKISDRQKLKVCWKACPSAWCVFWCFLRWKLMFLILGGSVVHFRVGSSVMQGTKYYRGVLHDITRSYRELYRTVFNDLGTDRKMRMCAFKRRQNHEKRFGTTEDMVPVCRWRTLHYQRILEHLEEYNSQVWYSHILRCTESFWMICVKFARLLLRFWSDSSSIDLIS